MSKTVRKEELPRLRQRYQQRGREGKKRLLDEFCEQWGYSRKHAIKLLGSNLGEPTGLSKRMGRPPTYSVEMRRGLKEIWLASDQMCGKRLKRALPLWIPHYEALHGKLQPQVVKELKAISAASIDRVLAPFRARYPSKGLGGTKPGSLLKTQIPIKTDHWDVKRPGFLEADTVAHCGASLAGEFIWSVTFTDIHSGWSQCAAVWNKGSHGVVQEVSKLEQSLPFRLLGFDCDNGSEFLNYHLLNYFSNRKRGVQFTRSRPYHKNDNAHVEQKNWTHVRQLLGYDRLEDPELIEPINKLYRELWEPYHNFFCPSMKLKKKVRIGGKTRRYYEDPATPYQRLVKSRRLSPEQKKRLSMQYKSLNPFDLKIRIEGALGAILAQARRSSRPTGSLRGGPKFARKESLTKGVTDYEATTP